MTLHVGLRSSLFDLVLLGALGAVPLPLRRHHDSHALKVEPLDAAVGGVAADHL